MYLLCLSSPDCDGGDCINVLGVSWWQLSTAADTTTNIHLYLFNKDQHQMAAQ